MFLYFILSIVGFFLGIILAITAIIFRKRIEPSVMMCMICLGGFIIIASVFFFAFFGLILPN